MMPLSLLRQYEQCYLAAPYTITADRAHAASEAARVAGELLLEDIVAYSPTVIGHAMVSQNDDLDVNDPELWDRFNMKAMEASDAMVILQLPGWNVSAGIAREKDYFRAEGKPVHYLDPVTLELR